MSPKILIKRKIGYFPRYSGYFAVRPGNLIGINVALRKGAQGLVYHPS